MCLKDSAAEFVKNISVTDANYKPTWEALKARYSNPRLCLHTHLSTLMNLPKMMKESASELRTLVDRTIQVVRALENLGRPVATWDDWLVFITAQRLDKESRKSWESHLTTKDRLSNLTPNSEANPNLFPSFRELVEFLEGRIRALEMIAPLTRWDKGSNTTPKFSSSGAKSFHVETKRLSSTSTRNCPICSMDHYIAVCSGFLEKTPVERRDEARKLHLCFNCLGRHRFKECKSVKRCVTCRGRHHSLLHTVTVGNDVCAAKGTEAEPQLKSPVEANGIAVNTLTANLAAPIHSVILATAQVLVTGPRRVQVKARALLDNGSEVSFITEALAQLLHLPRQRTQIPLSGIGAAEAGTALNIVQLSLYSVYSPSFCLEVKALVLPRLTNQLPTREIIETDLSLFSNLQMADPLFYKPETIDLILGADVYGLLLRQGLQRFPHRQIIAQNTALGWVISGPTVGSESRRAGSTPRRSLVSLHCEAVQNLLEDLQRFWEVEEVPPSTRTLRPEDERCEQHFKDTHSRGSDGRYIVQLPIVSELPVTVDETRRTSLSSLASTEQRFVREPEIAAAYRDFMKVYEELGHMVKVPTSDSQIKRAWYLPHHAVVHTPSLKLRVVFDASRRTSQHYCLNDFLPSGPPLQKDLGLVLINWRRHRFVFTADIVKMFRQIWVHPADQDLQRIVWRPHPNTPAVEYRLTTVTYGTACAPFLAMRSLLQLAEDEEHRFPLGAACLRKDSYVDDIFSGADELLMAQRIATQLVKLLACAGIELDKWAVNHPALLQRRASQRRECEQEKSIDSKEPIKTLGLIWEPTADLFGFNLRVTEIHTMALTKRTVLSKMTRLFDPLGWVAPVTVVAKILMQDMWILKIGWDTPLPTDIKVRWTNYFNAIPRLSKLRIDRWLQTTPTSRCELHGFADASERAYAAAIYLRVLDDANQCRVFLLAAKSKVTPVKTITIPKLELCGAALLVRLVNHLQKIKAFSSLPVFAWSDSQVTLAWLRKHPSYWKTFIANRVSFIQTELLSAVWQYVSSEQNPADHPSRGLDPDALINSSLWWRGPEWLLSTQENWPRQPEPVIVPQLFVVQAAEENAILKRFSSITRLTRVMAYCLRFIARCQRSRIPNTNFLSTSELAAARCKVLQLAQSFAFSEELKLLRAGKPLPRRNPLRGLKPFLDENGILRVGGRLKNSTLSFSAKHPSILPKRSHLSQLLVQFAHLSSLHGGPTLTLNTLRSQTWILGDVALVKKLTRQCVICHRAKPRFGSQLMSDLPATRTTPARPFSVAGLDYAGPFYLRTTKGRGHRSYKGYVALFVCFATRAIHLEAVSDLTTHSFLAAYRRFAGRRGVCRTLYSDNATTFQGAAKELRRMFGAASDFYAEVASVLANDGTSWSFIPPNSPHFGGLWEAGVKSTKHHLLRVVGEHTLTFEEFSTVLIQIEACLNSRPLHPLSSDPDDLNALTPAHFLIGGTLFLIPEPECPNISGNCLSRWRLLLRLQLNFWKRWSREYLHHLQQRTKWRDTSRSWRADCSLCTTDSSFVLQTRRAECLGSASPAAYLNVLVRLAGGPFLGAECGRVDFLFFLGSLQSALEGTVRKRERGKRKESVKISVSVANKPLAH
ncbi:uncharacterized protein LOC124159470 [Ischnura elegans]|uniref:uncharacterized protein LOC124159470 n=1 Tax=Ischnura elegans TaxID=197161 RepID=UPI001ED86D22|nr:uncharacterized protein LOC124159470 [Ischnura elegans]